MKIETSKKAGFRSGKIHYWSRDSASATISNIRKPFSYWVQGFRRKSINYHIDVIRRPEIESFHITLFYPSYLKKKHKKLNDNIGVFYAPIATRARFKLQADKKLISADLIIHDSKPVPMTVTGKSAARTITITKPITYSFRIKSMDSLYNIDPVNYRISIIKDMEPSVSILRPSHDITIDKTMLIPLVAVAEDDLGLTRTFLHYRIMHENDTVPEDSIMLSNNPPKGTRDSIVFSWNCRNLDLYPGDVLEFWIKTRDNDIVTGPKTAKSSVLRTRFPSAVEIFAQMDKNETELMKEAKSLREKQRLLRKETSSIARKLQFGKPGWKENNQINRMRNKQQELLKDIDSLSRIIRKQFSDALSDNHYRKSVLQKMKEIRQAMKKIESSEFEKIFKNLTQKPEKINLRKLKRMFEQSAKNQHDILEQLDKMLNLLQKLQAKYRIRQIAEQLDNLSQKQNSLASTVNKKKKDFTNRQNSLAGEFQKVMERNYANSP